MSTPESSRKTNTIVHIPPYAVCSDCKQDVRASEPHCPEIPNVSVTEGGTENKTCFVCDSPSSYRVHMRWHYRVRSKYRGREWTDPLDGEDHWKWLNYDACERCAAHATAMQKIAIGWDYWDAADSIPNPPTKL